jgi:NADH dehydrogenase FAD-containing subunit
MIPAIRRQSVAFASQKEHFWRNGRKALSTEAFHFQSTNTHPDNHFDVLIAGGGLLGLSCAYHLVKLLGPKQAKQLRIGLIEKEDSLLSLTSSASTGGYEPLIS